MKEDFIYRVQKFQKLSKKNQAKVLRALRKGRVYLSDKTNKSDAIAGLWYTKDHNGKMKNLCSVSTSVLDNHICQARRMDETSICSKCFSAAQMDCFKEMQPVMKRNLEILCSRLLDEKEIPVILSNSGLFRVEAFGDCCNVIQAANYLRICAANPWLNCAIWTKNPIFYHEALRLELAEKPKNLNIVLSSSKVNCVSPVPEKYEYFIDRVFTVYDEPGIKEQGITINCGALSCATCRKCYTKTDKFFEIREKLK